MRWNRTVLRALVVVLMAVVPALVITCSSAGTSNANNGSSAISRAPNQASNQAPSGATPAPLHVAAPVVLLFVRGELGPAQDAQETQTQVIHAPPAGAQLLWAMTSTAGVPTGGVYSTTAAELSITGVSAGQTAAAAAADGGSTTIVHLIVFDGEKHYGSSAVRRAADEYFIIHALHCRYTLTVQTQAVAVSLP